MMRRNSLGFEFPPSGESFDDEEADADSAFVDDDLESSWDQLRMRQFKEQLSLVDEAPTVRSPSSVIVRLMKRLMTAIQLLFANGRLDKYEKLILVLAILLIADTVALSYLLATYPVYRDVLSRLGYQILHNSTGFFYKASQLRDL